MRTCRDCQFLVKTMRLENTMGYYNWDRNEIAHKTYRPDPGVKSQCHKGVWSEHLDPSLVVKEFVEKNRNDCQFFMPLRREMALNTAIEELDIGRQDKRHKSTIRAIVFAAILGGVIGGLIGLLG